MDIKFNIRTLILQLGVCVGLLILSPLSVYVFTHSAEDAEVVLKIISPMLVPCFPLFFLNYYLLLPKLFFKGKKALFYVANIPAIIIIKIEFIIDIFRQPPPPDLPTIAWLGFAAVVFVNILFYAATIFTAWGLLNAQRSKLLREQLQEEEQRHTEAELVWLKNQINPHFLFNTLNNISSLVAIDIERTQDSIAALSDLLRYAMYESDKPSVPLAKEVEFMQNYISLMNLRCSSSTSVDSRFDISSTSVSIAPLLLVSFIENAYKHGVSNNNPSFISIKLTERDGRLEFTCDNSNFPKGSADRSGKGIGLQNTRRRLDLLYAGRYSWEQSVSGGVYHTKIEITL